MPSRQTALRTWSAHEPVGAIAFVTAMTVPSGVRTSGTFRRSSAVSKSNNVTADDAHMPHTAANEKNTPLALMPWKPFATIAPQRATAGQNTRKPSIASRPVMSRPV